MKRLLFLFSFLLFCIPQIAHAAALPQNRLIVKFHKEAGSQLRNQILNQIGVKMQEHLRLSDTVIVTVPQGKAMEFAQKFIELKDVDYAEPDYTASAFETPNDTRFSEQYGLLKIQAPTAWDTTHGSASISAAVVDTGIQGNHLDLSGKIQNFADCTLASCTVVNPFDDNGHGTHVAGIISANTNNGIGISGTGYNTSLMGVKVLDSSGSGYYSWIANGITWAADNGAKVINMSLGGSSSSSTLQNAVNYAWGKGVVIVAAAGNSNTNKKFYPAAYTNVISVAATDQNDTRASFSNYGSWVTVAAPGVSILSTYNNGDYAVLSGTSMASPHVAGEAALIFGKNSTLTNSQVRSKIQDSADKTSGTGTYWTYGRINLCSAVDCNGATPTPTATVTPSPTPTRTPTPTPTPKPLGTPTPTPKSGLCKLFPSFCK